MAYTENRWQGNEYRQEYLNGVNSLIKKLRKSADEQRYSFRNEIMENPSAARQELKRMLGYPLTAEFDEKDIPDTKKIFVAKDEDVSIYRMQIEILPDLWMYGLYFVREDSKKRPFIVCQHGGGGTCEICSSFFNSAIYNDMVQRVLRYDVNVFAPQLLLWQSSVYGIDYDRKEIDINLKQVGSSITALEVYGIKKCINYFASQNENDPENIAMIGLSYGGFYTLFTTACDTRIKAALSSSFYNNRYIHNWSDWIWDSSAKKFLDNEVALLIYPRQLNIAIGDDETWFLSSEAKKAYADLKDFLKGNDQWLTFDAFKGSHEFPPEEEYLEKFMKKFLNK